MTSFLHLVMGQQALLCISSVLGSQPSTREGPGDQRSWGEGDMPVVLGREGQGVWCDHVPMGGL